MYASIFNTNKRNIVELLLPLPNVPHELRQLILVFSGHLRVQWFTSIYMDIYTSKSPSIREDFEKAYIYR